MKFEDVTKDVAHPNLQILHPEIRSAHCQQHGGAAHKPSGPVPRDEFSYPSEHKGSVRRVNRRNCIRAINMLTAVINRNNFTDDWCTDAETNMLNQTHS